MHFSFLFWVILSEDLYFTCISTAKQSSERDHRLGVFFFPQDIFSQIDDQLSIVWFLHRALFCTDSHGAFTSADGFCVSFFTSFRALSGRRKQAQGRRNGYSEIMNIDAGATHLTRSPFQYKWQSWLTCWSRLNDLMPACFSLQSLCRHISTFTEQEIFGLFLRVQPFWDKKVGVREITDWKWKWWWHHRDPQNLSATWTWCGK